ncbi:MULTISPECIES: alpha/beta hydrolase [Streptomyces]|uniref:alpha/beta hydrolase n=1 Tax=Streptomyces TaxID=1883 RepID=UPI001E40F6AF|nr:MULTISPECIES: alpha/beta hydrolase [Streptomyces]UFQ18405.1 alpha/beta hydrolase family protein [Streptomyces huasconensis]WCL88018.1 alpha/beta hydrolase [Streptomyces sp. JCM 35825]
MITVLTWQQLRDLKLSELNDAGDSWGAVSRQADSARTSVEGGMAGALSKTQESESARSAVRRLKRLERNYHYIQTESGLIRSALHGLAEELSAPRRQLRDALDDAAALSYAVNTDGSIDYPAGGENMTTGKKNPGGTAVGHNGMLTSGNAGLGPSDSYLRYQPPSIPHIFIANPHQAKAQDIADRIARALREAQEIDARYSSALHKLKAAPGLTVDTKTWADAAADAEAVRTAAEYLSDDIPYEKSATERMKWWEGLSQEQREEYMAVYPDVIGNLDGIPAEVRDAANRENLQLLMGKLAGQDDEKSRTQLAGLAEIDRQLASGSKPPMFLLGIGDEGNGRAIVSFGNPDTARNVSAYVPGLGTALDEDFAKNDLKRARDTAIGAQAYDSSSASIVWLGYDAPQLPDRESLLGNVAVMGSDRAEKGAPAYNSFMDGLDVTNRNGDPHLTAIGHSYGSRTVGAATQEAGGIPGADDIILLGSPGVGVDRAEDLGVGKDHVFVGAAENDPVSHLPSKTEAAVGAGGFFVGGPMGSYVLGDFADKGDDDLWFGKDPASEAFGARRFVVDDGPRPFIDGQGPTPAHSNYFNPQKDQVSADNVARVVSGNSGDIKVERYR